MADISLATKYSSETYEKALKNIVRVAEKKDENNTIKYSEAAIGMDDSTASVSLKYLAEIGLLESPKAGHYEVPEEVIKYRNGLPAVQERSKKNVESRLREYPLYDETVFLLDSKEYSLEDLAEEVGGRPSITASKDELGDIKRSLKIISELGFLQINEDGKVSTVVESEKEIDSEESENKELDSTTEDSKETSKKSQEKTSSQDLGIELDVKMDVTEMTVEEIQNKMKTIQEVIKDEEELEKD